MKKIKLALLAAMLFTATLYGQSKPAAWPEMKAFHAYMAATFHPAEEGNLQPLKEKADSLYLLSKLWRASAIPADYKPEETKAALKTLSLQCSNIQSKVKANASDEDLKKLIAEAHETFHKIVGECKKNDN